MSFEHTDLLTMIVRAHDQHNVAIGKVMRIALQAAAHGKFPLHKSDGKAWKLSQEERNWLLTHASKAEQQNEVRWWRKRPWIALQAVFVSKPKFWGWFNPELAAVKTTIVATASAKTKSGAKSKGIDLAVEAIWRGKIPEGLSAKERNEKIIDWLVNNGHSRPSYRTIQRALNTQST